MIILSDLHLEFEDFEITNPNNESVLILAGDICCAKDLTRPKNSSKYYLAQRYLKFFYDCSRLFDTVIYVMGNHEHYGGLIEDTANQLRLITPANFYLLDNESVTIDSVTYYGGTLWTDLSNPVHASFVEQGLNDYRLIKTDKVRGYPSRITPDITTRLHKDFIDNFNHDADVVISHHLPSFACVNKKYMVSSRDIALNYGYASETGLLGDVPVWIHGHTHASVNLNLGNTKVVANPRGYNGENRTFDPNFTLNENIY